MRSLKMPDRFLLLLFGTVAFATLLPAENGVLSWVGRVSTAAIVTLFFLHGLRLSREKVAAGVRHWRLQVAILVTGYALMPLIGFGAASATAGWIGAGLASGFVFLCVLPTTVQSSIAYTSIAGGNVAAAVVASALSNILGVLLAPMLFALIAHVGGGAITIDGIVRIASILLLPFAAGQLMRRWLAKAAERNARPLAFLDKLTILLAVYVAFSEAASDGLWGRLAMPVLVGIAAVVLVVMLASFALAFGLGRLLGFDPADRATLVFAGAQKSLATGAPMARVLFPGAEAAAVLLPLLLYHGMQLMLSAPLAARMARASAGHRSTDGEPPSPKRA